MLCRSKVNFFADKRYKNIAPSSEIYQKPKYTLFYRFNLKVNLSYPFFMQYAHIMSIPTLEKSTILLNVLNVADVILTWISINFCNAVEANPIALSIFGIMGYIPFLLLKILFIFGITLMLNHYSHGSIYQKMFEAVLITSFGFVTINNFLVIMEGAIL